MNYLPLAFLWVLFCAIHSAIISLPVTGYAKRKMGDHFRFYRLYFNVVSVITFVPLLMYSASFITPPFLVWNGAFEAVRVALIIIGVLLIIAGARHYSFSRFLGIQQIREKGSGTAMSQDDEVVSSGIHGIVRHPWYVAVFLLLWAQDQDVSSAVINGVLTAYLVVGTLIEERKLVVEFGEKYREYQRNVSMFFPLKWLKKRLAA